MMKIWYICSEPSPFAIMAQTLEYLLEQNKKQQEKLRNDVSRQEEKAYFKALRWIERKDPKLAKDLLALTPENDRGYELVFKKLCEVYGDNLWKISENEIFLRSKYSLIGYLQKQDKEIDDFYGYNKTCVFIGRVCQCLLLVSFLSKLIAGVVFNSFIFNLSCIYLGSILVREILKRVHIQYNLKWYVPIYNLYDFEKRNSYILLKEEEALLRSQESHEQIIPDAVVFEDDSAWFNRALAERTGSRQE